MAAVSRIYFYIEDSKWLQEEYFVKRKNVCGTLSLQNFDTAVTVTEFLLEFEHSFENEKENIV